MLIIPYQFLKNQSFEIKIKILKENYRLREGVINKINLTSRKENMYMDTIWFGYNV